jgi:hypothetical protein
LDPLEEVTMDARATTRRSVTHLTGAFQNYQNYEQPEGTATYKGSEIKLRARNVRKERFHQTVPTIEIIIAWKCPTSFLPKSQRNEIAIWDLSTCQPSAIRTEKHGELNWWPLPSYSYEIRTDRGLSDKKLTFASKSTYKNCNLSVCCQLTGHPLEGNGTKAQKENDLDLGGGSPSSDKKTLNCKWGLSLLHLLE